MKVIAVDATPTQPSELVTSLFVNIGERYDVLVCPTAAAGDVTGTSHWIRVGESA